MCDPTLSPADLARVVCDNLVAAGKLKATPAFIREDREKKIAGLFETVGLSGEKMNTFSNPRECEVLIRGATQGESWVDDVQQAVKSLLSAEAAAAAPKSEVSEEMKEAELRYQEKRDQAREEAKANEDGGGDGGGDDRRGGEGRSYEDAPRDEAAGW